MLNSSVINLFYRAYRINRFFEIYNSYLIEDKKREMTSSNVRYSMFLGDDDNNDMMEKKFQKLNEKYLIIWRLATVITVTTLIGVASFFFPFLYSIVPVYETQMCFSYFETSPIVIPRLMTNQD
jgi:hypothetical protein